MIVRTLEESKGSHREVEAPNGNWVSRRLILKEDKMGFSLHDTIIRAGTETFIWYKHHLEAVYCISGKGEIAEIETGILHPIEEGTVYALDGHESHKLRAFVDMRMVCIFTPPLTGKEVHTKEGFYPLEVEK
ncbi:MAG: ectoine synthase [SAR324 cluster bacterium]|nr:ectoine synthase [SAR324 cluster bacterium]